MMACVVGKDVLMCGGRVGLSTGWAFVVHALPVQAWTRAAKALARACLRRGGAVLLREHRELAEIGAWLERGEHDGAVVVFYLHATVLDEVHPVARLVHAEEEITAQQHLCTPKVSGLAKCGGSEK